MCYNDNQAARVIASWDPARLIDVGAIPAPDLIPRITAHESS